MNKPLLLLAAATLLATSASADIRSYHGGFTIGIGSHHGHHGHRHGHHHHSFAHRHGFGHHRYHHGYLGLGYSSIFHPAYFSNYTAPVYTAEERTVIVRERAPELPRPSSYAPTWTSGGGWKTHPWYRSRPSVITVPDTLRDARSSAQLQQIYGDQAAALAR